MTKPTPYPPCNYSGWQRCVLFNAPRPRLGGVRGSTASLGKNGPHKGEIRPPSHTPDRDAERWLSSYFSLTFIPPSCALVMTS